MKPDLVIRPDLVIKPDLVPDLVIKPDIRLQQIAKLARLKIDNEFEINERIKKGEDPRKLEEEKKEEEKKQGVTFLSPISQDLFNLMRVSVLKHVDDLLFSATTPRTDHRVIKKVRNLSSEKNIEILNSEFSFDTFYAPDLSIYRISLFLFAVWVEGDEFNLTREEYKEKYFLTVTTVFSALKMHTYLCKVREIAGRNSIYFLKIDDFCPIDVEAYEENFEIISELEETRIEVFQEFLLDLKPVLRKGVIESLKYSSHVDLSEYELSAIYCLLGYFSTDTGRAFLINADDPELIKRARKLGDFTGLKTKITQREIRELLADMTGIPIQSISNEESKKLLNLEATLHKRVIGQEEAVSAIAKAIRRSRLGIQNPKRPIASFLFCGPTGVGKTEVTKALAVSMFGAESDMIRFDMSEFMEKFTISRLIGSPPGYVGYEDGGQLTDAVRRKPYSVVLFDEIEKAHPDILNLLLQILEDGRLTDSQKRLVPFDNTVIIMTSNAAADEIQQIIKTDRFVKAGAFPSDEGVAKLEEEAKNEKEKNKKSSHVYEDAYSGAIEFLSSPITESFLIDIKKQLSIEFEKSFRTLKEYEFLESELKKVEHLNEDKTLDKKTISDLKGAVLERLSTMFLPEFLNRLDDIIIFQPLKPEELRKICDIMISDVSERIKSKQIILNVDDRVKAKLTREGYNPLFGARPLRRLVTKYIEDLISENLLKNPAIKKSRTVKIILNEDDQVIIKQEQKKS